MSPGITIEEVVRAVRRDREAAYCRRVPSNTLVEPREVWLPADRLWVQCDGRRVSGALRGMIRPGLVGQWRIRRAFRARTYPIRGLL